MEEVIKTKTTQELLEEKERKTKYLKEYYQKNKERYRKNFKNWYNKEGNKDKMKLYMRNFMRKKLNVTENNFRVKEVKIEGVEVKYG